MPGLPGVRDWVLTLCLCERTEGLSGSWKEGGGVPSSTSSSGYWSWSAPSDQSNPSTPSPPLSADSFKPFRSPAPPDDGIDEAEASNLLFDEPIPRKRKVGFGFQLRDGAFPPPSKGGFDPGVVILVLLQPTPLLIDRSNLCSPLMFFEVSK